eukprot:TRINITY_DN9197_c0_g1_i1.p1 TRINITY_DN9197_c0_g1~~TRINITY_DN9197_c0_g1_i1.p1  ORF type:complete len:424 (-),score=61.91 TRINITY_DN9197_c0_g1_i1:430-1701(-)
MTYTSQQIIRLKHFHNQQSILIKKQLPRQRYRNLRQQAVNQYGVDKKEVKKLQQLFLGGVMSVSLLIAPVSEAADPAVVGSCLLKNCQVALAKCLGDVGCLENLVCLQSCNGKPDEAGCQVRCGDLYEDKAVDTFNSCAVSDKKCVPQKIDDSTYPVPPDCSLDTKFSLDDFQGRWYITAGYNQLFDTFDCQEHFFAVPQPGRLFAKINWRIDKPDNDFIQRSTMQRFVQQSDNPALLQNRGNEYLHYEDDWYIISSKPDNYVFVYYIGNNDAWKGYGGAVVYTRASSFPVEYIDEMKQAATSVGLDWDKFTITDNTCPPHPPPKSIVQELEDDVIKVEKATQKAAVKEAQEIEYVLDEDLMSFGRGFTVIEGRLSRALYKEEMELEKGFEQAKKMIQKFEKQSDPVQGIESLFGNFFSFLKR